MHTHIPGRIACALAGALGAAGVAAAALAAHGGYGDNLKTASAFALAHAALVFALCGRGSGRMAQIAAWIVLAGALLFCGDLARRALAGAALFANAAPAGGFLMIAGWLAAGLAKASERSNK